MSKYINTLAAIIILNEQNSNEGVCETVSKRPIDGGRMRYICSKIPCEHCAFNIKNKVETITFIGANT